ncbi:hypothetical protein [Roseomonas sp. BN140053]|uniref:hypothetical protein n=1 Tax=Roseomonas sp. BN140053 TaxID=3391898 RepID=UPI0039E935CA
MRRWWVAAVLLNAAVAAVVTLGVALLPRAATVWLGFLPILSAPLLIVAPWLSRHRPGRGRVHRVRPGEFPPAR